VSATSQTSPTAVPPPAQISSAVRLCLNELGGYRRHAAIDELRAFDEPRYLHQTVTRNDKELTFFEDLSAALREGDKPAPGTQPADEWRVHFHVPIFADRIGLLRTTADQILPCIKAARERHDVRHFEVETYAWNVLPPALQINDLVEGIAHELRWLLERIDTRHAG
jgi:hypothetical protein